MVITARMFRDARLLVRKKAGVISSGSPEDYLIDSLQRAAWALERIAKGDSRLPRDFQLEVPDEPAA